MHPIKRLTKLNRLIIQTITFLRIQDYYHGLWNLQKLLDEITALFSSDTPFFSEETSNEILQCIENISTAQVQKDTVLLADLLELQLTPLIQQTLDLHMQRINYVPLSDYLESNLSLLRDDALKNLIRNHCDEAQASQKYCVELTNSGLNTLKYQSDSTSFYFHSNSDPQSEGAQIARYYAKKENFDYLVYGFGFGYHILGLLNTDRRFQITVLETDLTILTLAFIHCDLSEILSQNRVHLIYCKIDEIASHITSASDNCFVLHSPSLNALPDGPVKDALNHYFIQISSIYAQQGKLDANFYYNLKRNDNCIDLKKEFFKNKDAIFIAGGPSLEYFMEYVREKRANANVCILCASTVYRKLLSEGITPDFVIMTDVQDGMTTHLQDLPQTSAELIYLCTCSTAAVRLFKGPSYICFQSGYTASESYAHEHTGITLFDTGGTVSTTAIDLLLKYNCRSITTLGLDLAYTDNKHHSFDEADSAERASEHMPMVKSVTGQMIPTTNVFNIYRQWVEHRIENEHTTKLINLSHGAYIHGMENRSEL